MAETKKIRRYRETLQDMAKPQTEERHKVLEGKAAKRWPAVHWRWHRNAL